MKALGLKWATFWNTGEVARTRSLTRRRYPNKQALSHLGRGKEIDKHDQCGQIAREIVALSRARLFVLVQFKDRSYSD